MVLSLSDFECALSPPDWLHSDNWEDILAASVLPGPLDSVCVNFAKESEDWRKWYEHATPEDVETPLETSTNGKGSGDVL